MPTWYPVRWFEEVESTNDRLRALAEADPALPEGTVVAARRQRAGRGRRGRRWHTGAGNLAFSFLLRRAPLRHLPGLNLVVSLGVAEGLGRLGVPCRLKWPNDVLAEGAKIAGILAETTAAGTAPSGETDAVVGVGVNVNLSPEEAAALDRPVTGIRLVTGIPRDPPAVLETILHALAPRLDAWRAEGFGAVREAWLARADGLGEPRGLSDGDRMRIEGIVDGVEPDGALRLVDTDGRSHRFYAGELDPPRSPST